MRSRGPTNIWIVFVLILSIAVVLFAVLMWATTARATTYLATEKDKYLCSLYAREQARIDIMHTLPITPFEAQGKYPITLTVRIFQQCISVLPMLLPLTPEHQNLDSWHTDMQTMIQWRLDQLGVRPAAGRGPTPVKSSESPEVVDDEEWRRQCAAEYNSWNPDTGTVVRKGNPEPVRCPCGTDVVCEAPQ